MTFARLDTATDPQSAGPPCLGRTSLKPMLRLRGEERRERMEQSAETTGVLFDHG
jgi:hypothetical protein